ncbi:MAG: carbohydrate porin [Zymomonas mobilis]|uniref:Porin n=1 Tax=Zymomonas mobilis TaxID=542 RepID=A0A542W113_ZYMMB|nr:carbohydrate porin [Zymomonas mobilis]TQL17270.1 porin [Zymomonas mobilis]
MKNNFKIAKVAQWVLALSIATSSAEAWADPLGNWLSKVNNHHKHKDAASEPATEQEDQADTDTTAAPSSVAAQPQSQQTIQQPARVAPSARSVDNGQSQSAAQISQQNDSDDSVRMSSNDNQDNGASDAPEMVPVSHQHVSPAPFPYASLTVGSSELQPEPNPRMPVSKGGVVEENIENKGLVDSIVQSTRGRHNAFGWIGVGDNSVMLARDPKDRGIFGTWLGIKPWLRDKGIDIQSSMGGVETAFNARGGDRHALRTAYQWLVQASFDMERLGVVKGGKFNFMMTKRGGGQIEQAINATTLTEMQEVYGRGNIWRLIEGSYEQQLGRFNIKVGRLTENNEFGMASTGCSFMSLGFCGNQAGNLVGDYWYNWPVSNWAGRVTYQVSKEVTIGAGVFDVNRKNIQGKVLHENFYMDNPFHPEAGLYIGEVKWAPKFGREKNLEGMFKFDGWYTDDKSYNLRYYQDVAMQTGYSSQGPEVRGRYGAYVTAEQQVLRFDDHRQLTVAFRALKNDGRTNKSTAEVSAYAILFGVSKERPDDWVGIGSGTTWLSNAFLKSDALSAQHRHQEYYSELFYNIQISPAVFLRPNIQYVVHPGGYYARGPVDTPYNYNSKNIILLGLKSGWVF